VSVVAGALEAGGAVLVGGAWFSGGWVGAVSTDGLTVGG
jgi:hypothetical protein